MDNQAEFIELQRELGDLLRLAVVCDHVRWVVLGSEESAELGDWLREAAAQCREWADRVARYLVAAGVAPDGRVRSLAKGIPWSWVPPGWLSPDRAHRLVADRLATGCEWARYRRMQATSPGAGQLLDGVSAALEAYIASLPGERTAAGAAV